MTIARPYIGILNFKIIPVDCSICEYYGNLLDINDDTKKALIGATVAHSLNEERKMLIRIRELVNRHLNSKHKMILRFTSKATSYKDSSTSEPDPAFEKDLANNPDISTYLRDTCFDLDSRENFTKDQEAELQTFHNRKDIKCPKCSACLVVPYGFYKLVGRYEDDIAYERSKRISKLMRARINK